MRTANCFSKWTAFCKWQHSLDFAKKNKTPDPTNLATQISLHLHNSLKSLSGPFKRSEKCGYSGVGQYHLLPKSIQCDYLISPSMHWFYINAGLLRLPTWPSVGVYHSQFLALQVCLTMKNYGLKNKLICMHVCIRIMEPSLESDRRRIGRGEGGKGGTLIPLPFSDG